MSKVKNYTGYAVPPGDLTRENLLRRVRAINKKKGCESFYLCFNTHIHIDSDTRKVWRVWYIGEWDSRSFGKRNNPHEFVYVQLDDGKHPCGVDFAELSPYNQDRILDGLNDIKAWEKENEKCRLASVKADEFMKEYRMLCKKYKLHLESDDPYCGLNVEKGVR